MYIFLINTYVLSLQTEATNYGTMAALQSHVETALTCCYVETALRSWPCTNHDLEVDPLISTCVDRVHFAMASLAANMVYTSGAYLLMVQFYFPHTASRDWWLCCAGGRRAGASEAMDCTPSHRPVEPVGGLQHTPAI